MGEVNWGVRNEYSYGDVEKLRGHENDSTSNVMNDVRKHTLKDAGESVAIRGDDKSAKQIREEDRKELETELAPRAMGKDLAVDTVIEAAADFFEAGGLALAKAGYETIKANVHNMQMGDVLNKAIERDNMQRAMLSQLNLPEAFKREAMRPFVERETEGYGSEAFHLAEKLHNDPEWHAKAAILQLHCDQGMNAARSMCDTAPNRSSFMAAHPDIAKKYAEDPAFKAGFDSIVWAHNEGAETYRAVCTDLEARDARYDAQHVAWRG